MSDNTQVIDKYVTVPNRLPLITVLIMGNFIALINETVMNVALPNVEKSFAIQTSTAQWLSTGYMLTISILIPISAFLMQRFTTRQLLITALSLFFAGTLLASISPTFLVLFIARIVQAAGSGIMLPLVTTIIITITPLAKRGSMLGLMGIVVSFAPALGPVYSGIIVQLLSWRYVFIIVLPISAFLTVFAAYYIRNVLETRPIKIDIISVILATIGFGGLVIGFSEASKSGWQSAIVLILLGLGIASLVSFAIRQKNMEDPLLNLKPFLNKNFLIAILSTITVMMCMFSAMILLPIFMQNGLNINPLTSGLLLLPGGIVFAVIAYISGILTDKYGAKPIAGTGSIILVITVWLLSNISTKTSNFQLMVLYAGFTFGVASILIPMMTLGLNQLSIDLYSHGSAALNAWNQVSGAIGPALFITLMTNESKTVAASNSSEALAAGVQFAFSTAIAFAIATVLFILFVKQNPSRTHTIQ
ncbi:DHA2 family efflux MFS transporter permease subunit [Terrilactibacillus sp. BCM23-1]|uniref:DHA2 family efflux MFS transporter permease subunit n=1 Tax=Terrilactibacillus tamarindi TaxID=2599694 RepID=A0A6N8CR71_9BACI|nr:DHA2 family efflux MFS transporter permease subunit [Terrilactibacillus tamarindi]MTT30456.1 DHA2 family efflux MFS transporter permease subunit [Terrilactibacillus tamarindi]